MIDRVFAARLVDLLAAAERGAVAVSDFLDPEQQAQAVGELCRLSVPKTAYCFFGGYPDAERKKLFCLPDWCGWDGADAPRLLWETGMAQDAVAALRITGSGYVSLGHRDYLGSLLATGIKRESVGDIAVRSDREAVVFVAASLASFFLQAEPPLMRVGADKVTVTMAEIGLDFRPQQEFREIRQTVASPRIDCVTAVLTRLSREKAKALLTGGKVRINFLPVTDADCRVAAGDQISIEGFGRYAVRACDAYTKKNRIRFCAIQYL